MLEVGEIELKLRNKQHQLENLAGKLSDNLKKSNWASGDVLELQPYISKSGTAEKEDYTQQELQQVKHAILRIKQGVYSNCELCQYVIEGTRLLALPYTALCSHCASEQ